MPVKITKTIITLRAPWWKLFDIYFMYARDRAPLSKLCDWLKKNPLTFSTDQD